MAQFDDDNQETSTDNLMAFNDNTAYEIDPEGDVLGQALDELAELIKPFGSDYKLLESLYYLLLLWASFEAYQLEPFIGVGGDEEGGGGAKIIPLDSGWKIYDYGAYLIASPGENYGTFCTGKLIEAAKKIIEIMVKRGAQKIGLSGHLTAKRAAWIECIDKQIKVVNYHPAVADENLRKRILDLRGRREQPLSDRRPV